MRKKGEKGAPTPEQMKKAKDKSKKKKMSSGYAYEMTLEEFEEVMDLEEINFWAEESDAAKRPEKSGAQTPAKPMKKEGSSKNKPGSAGKGGPSITFSEKVTKSLKEKLKTIMQRAKRKLLFLSLKKFIEEAPVHSLLPIVPA